MTDYKQQIQNRLNDYSRKTPPSLEMSALATEISQFFSKEDEAWQKLTLEIKNDFNNSRDCLLNTNITQDDLIYQAKESKHNELYKQHITIAGLKKIDNIVKNLCFTGIPALLLNLKESFTNTNRILDINIIFHPICFDILNVYKSNVANIGYLFKRAKDYITWDTPYIEIPQNILKDEIIDIIIKLKPLITDGDIQQGNMYKILQVIFKNFTIIQNTANFLNKDENQELWHFIIENLRTNSEKILWFINDLTSPSLNLDMDEIIYILTAIRDDVANEEIIESIKGISEILNKYINTNVGTIVGNTDPEYIAKFSQELNARHHSYKVKNIMDICDAYSSDTLQDEEEHNLKNIVSNIIKLLPKTRSVICNKDSNNQVLDKIMPFITSKIKETLSYNQHQNITEFINENDQYITNENQLTLTNYLEKISKTSDNPLLIQEDKDLSIIISYLIIDYVKEDDTSQLMVNSVFAIAKELNEPEVNLTTFINIILTAIKGNSEFETSIKENIELRSALINILIKDLQAKDKATIEENTQTDNTLANNTAGINTEKLIALLEIILKELPIVSTEHNFIERIENIIVTIATANMQGMPILYKDLLYLLNNKDTLKNSLNDKISDIVAVISGILTENNTQSSNAKTIRGTNIEWQHIEPLIQGIIPIVTNESCNAQGNYLLQEKTLEFLKLLHQLQDNDNSTDNNSSVQYKDIIASLIYLAANSTDIAKLVADNHKEVTKIIFAIINDSLISQKKEIAKGQQEYNNMYNIVEKIVGKAAIKLQSTTNIEEKNLIVAKVLNIMDFFLDIGTSNNNILSFIDNVVKIVSAIDIKDSDEDKDLIKNTSIIVKKFMPWNTGILVTESIVKLLLKTKDVTYHKEKITSIYYQVDKNLSILSSGYATCKFFAITVTLSLLLLVLSLTFMPASFIVMVVTSVISAVTIANINGIRSNSDNIISVASLLVITVIAMIISATITVMAPFLFFAVAATIAMLANLLINVIFEENKSYLTPETTINNDHAPRTIDDFRQSLCNNRREEREEDEISEVTIATDDFEQGIESDGFAFFDAPEHAAS